MPGANVTARRIVAHRAVLAGCCVVLAIVTLGLTALTSYLADSAVAAVRTTLSTGQVADAYVSYTTGLATDEARQSAATVDLLDKSFGRLPATVHRAVTTGAIALTLPGPPGVTGNAAGGSRPFELRAFAGPEAVATLVGGRWPTPGAAGDPVPVAIPRAAAEVLGLRIGQTLTPSNGAAGAVRVVAVIEPLAAAAAEFQPLAADDRTVGGGTPASILVTDEADLRRLVATPSLVWTVTPTAPAFDPADVEPMRDAAAATRRSMSNDAAINVQGVSESGQLSATLDGLARSLAAVRAAATAPLLLVGSFGVFLLVELSALAARARRPELALLATRGVPPRTVLARQLLESALLAVPAALAGWLASVLARRLTDAGRAAPGLPPWSPAAACALLTLAAAGVFAWRDGRRATLLAARRPGLSAVAPAVLIVAAAAVSLWRFLQVGSAVVTAPDGSTTLDPVALPAPALLLLAFAVGVGLLTMLAAGLVAYLAGRRRGTGLVLPARQVSRRLPAFGGVALLVGLAVAGVTVAAGYGPSRERLADLAAVLTTGADLRVQLPAGGANLPPDQDPAGAFRTLGPRQATSVFAAPIEIGSVEADLVAAPAASLTGLTPAAPHAYDPAAVAAAVAPGRPSGLPVPAGAGTIDLSLDVTSFAAQIDDAPTPTGGRLSVTVVLWLATADGPVLALSSTAVSVPVAAGNRSNPLHRNVSVAVPPTASTGPTTVVAADTALQADGADTIDSVTIGSIRAGTAVVPVPADQAWVAPLLDGQDADLQLHTGAAGSLSWGGRVPPAAAPVTVRLMPAAHSPPAGVPVVLNRALADRLGVPVGASLDLRLAASSRDLQVSVAAISPVLPGAAGGLIAVTDLQAATEQFLRTAVTPPAVDEVRIAGDGDRLYAAVVAVAGPDAVIDKARNQIHPVVVGPATTALWAGGGVTVLLAVLALAAATAGQLAERRDEAALLLASGMSRRSWVRGRRREFAGTAGIAACLGLVSGLIANRLTTGRLARSAVVSAPDGLPATITLSPMLWVVLVVAALATAGLLLAYGRGLARQWDRVNG